MFPSCQNEKKTFNENIAKINFIFFYHCSKFIFILEYTVRVTLKNVYEGQLKST